MSLRTERCLYCLSVIGLGSAALRPPPPGATLGRLRGRIRDVVCRLHDDWAGILSRKGDSGVNLA